MTSEHTTKIDLPGRSELARLIESAKPVRVFKDDRRSRVWQIRIENHASDTAHTDLVIKRFMYAPLRQRLGMLFGLHPAQRERRANRKLARGGLSVVPIVAHGAQRAGLGCRLWLITPMAGRSLETLLHDGSLQGGSRRSTSRAVGALAGRLIAGGWFFRDLKTSNIVMDQEGQPSLIDVGSVRRLRSKKQALRMLAMLDHTARRDGATATDRLRGLSGVLAQAGGLGTIKDLAQAVSRAPLPGGRGSASRGR